MTVLSSVLILGELLQEGQERILLLPLARSSAAIVAPGSGASCYSSSLRKMHLAVAVVGLPDGRAAKGIRWHCSKHCIIAPVGLIDHARARIGNARSGTIAVWRAKRCTADLVHVVR